MRIAYCIRPNFEDGGDGVQVVKTREYLLKSHPDLEIDIITSPESLNDLYDFIHIFNYATTDVTRAFFEKACSLNLKIVSSPIYWDYSYSIMPLYMYFWCNKSFISESFVKYHRRFNPLISLLPKKLIKNSYSNVSQRFKKDIQFFIQNSQLILPNSMREGELCCKFAGVPSYESKIREVYNGVDVSNVNILKEEDFFLKYQIPQNYILQVGRIEYLKNQMNLISSLIDYPEIPIILLGKSKEKRPYVKQIRKLALKRGNVFILDSVSHDDVYSFYRYAKVHVLLSMRESPGLVSLEALSQGCPIVVSDERCLPVKTYFKENFISVNPFNKNEIKEAILTSYYKDHQEVDLSKFSWSNVANMTYKAYQEFI